MLQDTISIRLPDGEHWIVNKENCLDVVDYIRNIYGWEGTPEFECFRYVNICPIPLFSNLSNLLLRSYRALNGIGKIGLFELQKYPAIYVRAVEIINGTEAESIKRYTPKDK